MLPLFSVKPKPFRVAPVKTGPGSQHVLYVRVVPVCIAECRQFQTMLTIEINVEFKFLPLQLILSVLPWS